MKPTKEIIEKAARRGALLQNVQLIMWEFVKKRESDESVNWIEYAGKIVDVVEGKDTPEGKLISTYKDKLWDKNLELDPDDDTPKETWEKRFLKEFVNTHNETWRPLRGLWVEDVLAFIAKELELAKADGAREVIDRQTMKYNKSTLVTNQFIASCKNGERPIFESMDYVAISRKQWDEIEKRLATLREDYKLKEKV